jgi:hypothetical protein
MEKLWNVFKSPSTVGVEKLGSLDELEEDGT